MSFHRSYRARRPSNRSAVSHSSTALTTPTQALPEVQKSIQDSGLELFIQSTEEFERTIRTGSDHYREAIRIAKVQPQP